MREEISVVILNVVTMSGNGKVFVVLMEMQKLGVLFDQ